MKNLVFEMAMMMVFLAAFMIYGATFIVNDFWGAMLWISIFGLSVFGVIPECITFEEVEEV